MINFLKHVTLSALAFGMTHLFSLFGLERTPFIITFWAFDQSFDIHILINLCDRYKGNFMDKRKKLS
jgi:hypothetical protein